MTNKLEAIFNSHDLLRLGTLDSTGFPNVRSVDFAHDPEKASSIYFTTFNATEKVKEIAADNRVYIVVDKSANSIEELAQIKYVRGRGEAHQVTTPEEMQKAMGLLLTKYPFLQDLPGDPSMMSVYRIELKEVNITDNSLGFGHVESLTF